jgi:hypothetical protein
MSLWNSSTEWAAWGTGSPKSPLYGIWEVDEMSIDGQLRPPLVTDAERWGRVVFDSPTYVAFQGMRGKLEFYDSAFDASTRMLTLTKGDDKPPKARLAVQQPQSTRLVLEGDLDGHKVHVVLRRTDQTKFMLLSRGFHWVQEYPFNR